MKRSKHVALWLTGSLALTGCHQTPDGNWAWGQPSVSGTNGSQGGGYVGSSHSGWWHSSGGGGGWGDSGGEEGVSRGDSAATGDSAGESKVERLTIQPRPDWQARVEALGLNYHTLAGEPYWDESVCYRFSAAEIDQIEAATNELHRICIEAAGHVIERKLYARFGIPERLLPLIENSWEREDLSLHGRFDLRFDGAGPPKMYEYNADTPTSLLEASVVQWYWLEEVFPKADQFNSIHEKLIARWKESGVKGTVHFACAGNHAEDAANTQYMEDVAAQAGIATKFLTMSDIGWNGRYFVDLQREKITTLFKLYPWEWMMDEEFGKHLAGEPWKVAEPAWKMILSSKAILPVLWELFPGHANLLPAFYSPEPLGQNYARKPVRGREGANVLLRMAGRQIETAGEYGREEFVYQQVCLPPNMGGRYPVIGSWIACDEAAGIGIRESDGPITGNTSRFVPHYFG